MSKKRITITIDKELYEAFRAALPSYVSMSGVFELLVREYMVGYEMFGWSIDEMFKIISGKTEHAN